ncbi:NADP-dependent malic enzyme [Methylomicrobium lacus]|uniref:NADP-dependent malic enzyme n=1 Tax=Methylomicrobium lacus TaxID=136992 RepID=UPI00045EC69A|nr:NADP-dependent malic enzyme [Methylomicrobium lacus]
MTSSDRTKDELRKQLREAALEYHEFPAPGKISVTPIKPLANQRDLSLAYSPGVAAACEEIAADPANVFKYTARGNLVAVISNGTAVLGLGNIGPLAAKPVMEGKGVLFKKFAGIDVFDIEIDEQDPDKLCDIIAALEPTFGGINLEDIKAPECFYVERKLRERMKIPVFHDDQHGTAIIVGAAILNGLKIVGKSIKQCKLVVSGAGAAALACLDLLIDLGFPIENITVTDHHGVVYQGRAEAMDPNKARFARETDARTLGDVIPDADIFLGLSAGGVLKPEMVKTMAARPLVLALANPNPEILPEEVKAVRDDAIIATGRSDYPNQVNNALCFPYIFRGALDSGATTITRAMEIAAVRAIAELAEAEQSEIVASIYGISELTFGPDYLIPMPFDPRLMTTIAPAIAKAAAESGVATRPIQDLPAYIERLQQFVYHSGTFMKPVFRVAKNAPAERKRIVFAEGEDERVLRAVQMLVDENIAYPTLIGRPVVLQHRIEKLGLRIKPGIDFTLVNPEYDERYRDFWKTYLEMTVRKGVSEAYAKIEMRRRLTLIGAMLVHKGDADGMICGLFGTTASHLHYIDQVLGKRAGVNVYAAMNGLILPDRQVLLVDTHINHDPNAEQLAEITLLAVEQMRRFGLVPRVALLSHSNFGTSQSESAQKMRAAFAIIQQRAPDLEIEGEIHGDTALDYDMLKKMMPDTKLKGSANLLVLPNIDAANIAYNLLKTASGNGIAIGPVLLGCARPVHILTPAATVRRIVNMAAFCVVDANEEMS